MSCWIPICPFWICIGRLTTASGLSSVHGIASSIIKSQLLDRQTGTMAELIPDNIHYIVTLESLHTHSCCLLINKAAPMVQQPGCASTIETELTHSIQ